MEKIMNLFTLISELPYCPNVEMILFKKENQKEVNKKLLEEGKKVTLKFYMKNEMKQQFLNNRKKNNKNKENIIYN